VLKVGLTGGLASGKSAVGRTLQELGCFVLRADELGHQVLEEEAREAVLAEFATTDRRRLSSIVFGDAEKLAKLNAIVHPLVRARAHAMIEGSGKEIAVVEAAILIETGSYRTYDKLIVAWCREEQQIERAMARDGLTREEVLARLSRQMPLEEKKEYADYLIDTSGTRENTAQQTKAVFEELRGLTR
jgi:dephospho-CoA kinase